MRFSLRRLHETVFTDPDAVAARALGISGTPALRWVSTEPAAGGRVAGWEPTRWRAMLTRLSRKLAWARPLVPAPGDLAPLPAEPLPVLTER